MNGPEVVTRNVRHNIGLEPSRPQSRAIMSPRRAAQAAR